MFVTHLNRSNYKTGTSGTQEHTQAVEAKPFTEHCKPRRNALEIAKRSKYINNCTMRRRSKHASMQHLPV